MAAVFLVPFLATVFLAPAFLTDFLETFLEMVFLATLAAAGAETATLRAIERID